MIVQWFETRAWQVGTVAASVVAVALGVTTVVLSVQKVGLQRDLARAEKTIEKSAADLAQCRGNVGRLEQAVTDQNAEVQRVARAGADRLKAAEAAIEASRSESRRLAAQVDLLLRTPALGADRCARVEEVDRAVQEAFQ